MNTKELTEKALELIQTLNTLSQVIVPDDDILRTIDEKMNIYSNKNPIHLSRLGCGFTRLYY